MDGHTNGLIMSCHQMKIDTYKDRLCIRVRDSNLKENNENYVAAHAFLSVFCSNWQPSQNGPTAENDGAAVPPTIFFLV